MPLPPKPGSRLAPQFEEPVLSPPQNQANHPNFLIDDEDDDRFGSFGNPGFDATEVEVQESEYTEPNFDTFSASFKAPPPTPSIEHGTFSLDMHDDFTPAPVEEEDTVSSDDGNYISIPDDRNYTPQDLNAVQMLIAAISSDESTEVIMNGPDEVMIKKDGARYMVPSITFPDADTYHNVIDDFILKYTDTPDRIADTGYLMEGQLQFDFGEDEPPMIARVHVMAPPVTRVAKVTIAKRSRRSYTVDDLVGRGSLPPGAGEFLKACSRGRVTTVFSGLSGAGKTTMLEACSHHFDQNDRIIVVEDIPELRLPVADTVKLTATSTKPGASKDKLVTLEWLVKATNRMRPDRIIVGEVRGGEMGEFLVAANSGADGSMTTVHAGDPQRTLTKMISLSMKAEGAKSELSVARDIASTVQLIVQLGLINGKHVVTHIEEVSETIREGSGLIATQPIFTYDRDRGTWKAGRPSESLVAFLAQRGVQVQSNWFI